MREKEDEKRPNAETQTAGKEKIKKKSSAAQRIEPLHLVTIISALDTGLALSSLTMPAM